MGFNKSAVSNVISELERDLVNSKNIINEAIKIDYKMSRFKVDLDVIKQIVNHSKNFEYPTSLTKASSIAVLYNGNPYVTITLAIKALQTNNNITFFANNNMIAINSVLIKIINLLIENNNYTNNTISFVNATVDHVVKNQNGYDLLLYIGSKYEYHKIKDKFNIKTLYNGYGTASFYISAEDEVSFENIINDINEYVYRNNIITDIYNEDTILELINNVNNLEPDDILSIFSTNLDTIEFLKKNVKYKRIFINQNPFTNYCYLFDINLP